MRPHLADRKPPLGMSLRKRVQGRRGPGTGPGGFSAITVGGSRLLTGTSRVFLGAGGARDSSKTPDWSNKKRSSLSCPQELLAFRRQSGRAKPLSCALTR